MDKNTVCGNDREAGSIVMVVSGGMDMEDSAQIGNEYGALGQRVLVFPNQELVTEWRERIAALA